MALICWAFLSVHQSPHAQRPLDFAAVLHGNIASSRPNPLAVRLFPLPRLPPDPSTTSGSSSSSASGRARDDRLAHTCFRILEKLCF
ncbi:hypothetical protein GUJ93_ZPchr0008g12767 [Zizania palustris]|uniref:Uncharacterized protein n=1 Tax=Zizania palustris TaxID=103762 RepID=A0A8J5RZ49_ZIZPA|nr:hypothetical protein GUJ93_ZPchr0008g12767 [Zizania palustris]